MASQNSATMKCIWSDKDRNREIVVIRKDRYHEITIVKDVEDRKDQAARSDKHLLVLMTDVSGSMFDGFGYSGSTMHVLNTQLQAVARKALEAGHEVLLLPWAQESSYWTVDAANVGAIFDQAVSENIIADRQRRRIAAPNEFQTDKWYGATLPRVAFDRFQQILMTKKEAGDKYEDITVLFSTDGAFSVPSGAYQPPEHHRLTDASLNDLGQFIINYQAPINMVYFGIKNDHVPDAQRIMSVFPNTRYIYARDKNEIPSKTGQLTEYLDEQISADAVFLIVDGKKQFVTVADYHMLSADRVEVHGAEIKTEVPLQNTEFVDIRAQINRVYLDLEDCKKAYFEAKPINEAILAADNKLTGIAKSLETLKSNNSERNRTRQYMYGVMRYKNQLQQFSAQQVHRDELKNARLVLSKQQDLVMVLKDKHSIAIAKQITRNRGRKRDYTVDNPVITTNEDKTRSTFTVTVKFANDSGNPNVKDDIRIYETRDVPQKVATDEEIDPITSETFGEIYAEGDTKGQAVLIERPNETAYHAPSKIIVKPAMAEMSLQTLYANVERAVEVSGFDSLFAQPFSGMTSEDKYNLVLPTWAPNLTYVCRYTLKPLLGYLIGGHELAYPSRAVDIYIPACGALWRKWRETRSTKDLERALFLTQAFKSIKRWTKLGNLHEPAATTPEANVKLFAGGDSGTHAFMSLTEPVLYAMLSEFENDEQRDAFNRALVAEQIYKIAHSWGDRLYGEVLVPVSKEIIHQTNLIDAPDFIEMPEWNADDKINSLVTKFMRERTLKSNNALMAVAPLLTRQVWDSIERDYKVPDGLNEQLLAAVDAADASYTLDAKTIVPLIAVANDFPSNGTRRELRKPVQDIFRDRLKQILAHELGDVQKERYYRNRFNTINETHAGLPLVVTYDNLQWLNQQMRVQDDSKQNEFITGFRTRFAAQLGHEITQFGLTAEEFEAKLVENLKRLWSKRATIGDIQISGTALPLRRCAHVLCHQFLEYDRSIENVHWSAMGTDLLRQAAFRTWVPGMHLEMSNRIHYAQKDRFVNEMLEYAKHFVHLDFHDKFQKYYSWHYDTFH